MVRQNLHAILENISLGGIALSILLTGISTTFRPNPQLASLGTLTGCAFAVGFKEMNRKQSDQSVLAERDALKLSLHQMELTLKNAQNQLQEGLQQRQDYYEGKLAEMKSKLNSDANLQTKFNEVKFAFDQRASELKNALSELEQLRSNAAMFQGQKDQWKQKFDDIISDHNAECKVLHDQITQLERENLEYKARFDSVGELAKLRADKEASELRESIANLQKVYDQKMGEYKQLAKLYNSLRTEDDAKLAEFQQKFAYLTGEGFKEVEQEFNSELSTRDRMLLAASAKISELEQPHYFDDIGDFTRANRIIKALWENETPVCLDASEIVPYSDNTGFELYLSLRDRRIRGQATIEALNDRGNEFSVICGCIKDLKFEYDRINPHRIKTSMIFRRKAKISTVDEIKSLWIPSEQFNRVYAALKKPVTRVMGATGEGKGIFVNLLLALEANQPNPSVIRLHDPMDGSNEDHWKISKTSSGENEVLNWVHAALAEFDYRLVHKIGSPKVIDIFDEIDILADRDSSINSGFLTASKGMRHCGMRAYIIGQSASVGKKGLEWADMDNFNAVYFGSSIITALDKTPALQTKSEALRKRYDKLKEFCDTQNEELGLDGWNEKRIGLLVTGGKAEFFELPSAESIPCDWSKLPTEITEYEKDSEVVSVNPDCPICSEKLRSKADRWVCDNKNHTKEMGQKSWSKANF